MLSFMTFNNAKMLINTYHQFLMGESWTEFLSFVSLVSIIY